MYDDACGGRLLRSLLNENKGCRISLALGGQIKMVMQKIDWLTGRAAPYRYPIWNYLAERTNFEARVLENETQFKSRPGNRPSDWYEHGSQLSQLAFVKSHRLQRGEENYYLARGLPLRSGLTGAVLGGWESPAYWQALMQLRLSSPRARAIGFYESTLATQGHKSGAIALARQLYFRHLDGVVVPGEASAEAVASMGVPTSRIHVGFNPVDVEWIARQSQRRVPSAVGHRFIFIGQMVARKQPNLLLEAFNTVRREGDSLTLIGSGALEDDVRARIASLGLGGSVQVQSTVSYRDIPAILARHDTLVLPSSTEVWGLVVNEALAAGLHAVVSRDAGVAKSVASMQGVFLCDPTGRGLATALNLSRQSWSGAIESPAIWKHTPAAFAEVFLSAL